MLLMVLSLSAMEMVVENYASGVEIWLLVPYDLFLFGAEENNTEYSISIQLLNASGKQIAVDEEELGIPRRSWLQSSAIPLRRHYQLDPGNYLLNVILRNRKLGDRHSFEKNFNIGTQYTQIGQVYAIARREDFSYVPEALDLGGMQELRLKQSFSITVQRLILKLDNQELVFEYPISPWEVNLKELVASDSLQTLQVSILEDNIRYNMDALTYRPWFSFNARYSAKDQLDQIRYVATQNEWRVLSKVPKAKIPDALESYWQAHDPTPGTLRNENREQFYSRVLRADEQFTIHKRLKGWRSDRGRIYIKFGEPEQIVNDAFPIGEAPSIRWLYYRLNREFIFTDEKGYGQYTLRNKDEEYLDY